MTDVSFEIARPTDRDDLVRCVQETFPGREPMAVALGIPPSDYLGYTEMVCEKAIEDDLTIVARERGRGRMVGFCIAEDLVFATRYSRAPISRKLLPLMALLEVLDDRYLDARPVEPKGGEICHLYMLGTITGVSRQGLGRRLIIETLGLAGRHGFKRAIAETTGPYSQKILRTLDFSVRESVEYRSFLYEGVPVFGGITEATHCLLVERRL
jgi:ribosomal protein S18 acetylase RimI-like enzyme